MSFVRTVLGDISPAELGVTYGHEHLLSHPAPQMREGSTDLDLEDLDVLARELESFKLAGGQAIVEMSCEEWGRDAVGLKELSLRSGIHLIAATGHMNEFYWRDFVDIGSRTDSDLEAEMCRHVLDGFDDAPGVRAGVIKAGTSEGRIHPDEERVLAAAARAQQRSGAPVSTHATQGTEGLQQIECLAKEGADLTKVLIGHQDMRMDWETHLAIVEAGCFIGYDQFSKDHKRLDVHVVEFIQRMFETGHGGQVVISGDLARRSRLPSFGFGCGPGLTYILWRIVPLMLQCGMTRAQVDEVLVHNPRRFLSFS